MGEQNFTREIQQTIDQQPLSDKMTKSVLTQWCTDSAINLKTIPRKEWEQKPNIFAKSNLYVPTDLHLWEMIGVIEAIDYNNFQNHPDQQAKSTEKITQLGQTFKSAGIYLAQRLYALDEGQSIAISLAEQFYNYGESLTERIKTPPRTINEISRMKISDQQTQAVDQFLAGDTLYQSRYTRAQTESKFHPYYQKNDIHENQRLATLNQFFKTAQKAFNLQQKEKEHYLIQTEFDSQPEQNELPVHQTFINQIEDSIKKRIEQPISELDNSILTRKTKFLEYQLQPEIIAIAQSLPDFMHADGQSLSELLKIDTLKNNLESLRQTNDSFQISRQEQHLAQLIQSATCGIAYLQKKYMQADKLRVDPRKISAIATSIGGELMREAGLNYLVGDMSGYSALFLITADNRVKFMDMTSLTENKNLNEYNLEQTTVNDIVKFSQNPKPEGFKVTISPPLFQKEPSVYTVYPPESGHRFSDLFSYATFYQDLAYHEKKLTPANKDYFYRTSLKFYGKIIDSKSQNENLWYNYGLACTEYADQISLSRAQKYSLAQTAIDAFRHLITINPQNDQAYFLLGKNLEKISYYAKAAKAYQKATEINPKNKQANRKVNSLSHYLDNVTL